MNIIPEFNPQEFRDNPFYRIHGLVLTQYTDEELTSLYISNVILYGQNALQIAKNKTGADGLYQGMTLSYIANCVLAHILYGVQYNLVGGSIVSSHKGQEGTSFFDLPKDKVWWGKTTHGGLVYAIMENNSSTYGYTSPNMFCFLGG